MPAKKVKDLAVKTGSYSHNGETKNRYKNVGSLMKSDDGSFFILLDKMFNPAGVPGESDRDTILISVFDLRDDAQAQTANKPSAKSAPIEDDTVPF